MSMYSLFTAHIGVAIAEHMHDWMVLNDREKVTKVMVMYMLVAFFCHVFHLQGVLILQENQEVPVIKYKKRSGFS